MEPREEPLLAPAALSWGLQLPVIATFPHPGITILRAAGELDLLTTPALQDQIEGQLRARRHVIVDLEGVTFFGSTAIQVLLRAHDRAADSDLGVHITGVHGQHLIRPLQLTGLDKVLSSSDRTPEALAARLARQQH